MLMYYFIEYNILSVCFSECVMHLCMQACMCVCMRVYVRGWVCVCESMHECACKGIYIIFVFYIPIYTHIYILYIFTVSLYTLNSA